MKITFETFDDNIKMIEVDGTERFVPKDESNSDYQRYLRWLNGEEETGTIA